MSIIWIWTIIIAVALIVEFFTFQMISLWLAVGSLFGLILAVIGGISVEVQVIVSVVIALICILALRPFALKFLNKTSDTKSAEILIGKKAKLLEEIKTEDFGLIKLNGIAWTVFADEEITANTEVEVIEIAGNKLKVKKIN